MTTEAASFDPARLEQLARVADRATRWKLEQYAKPGSGIHLWCKEQLHTFDEQRALATAPWPSSKPYVRDLIDELVHNRFIACEKSRQMFVTWIVCAYALYQLQFQGGVRWGVMSTKSETANAALGRCYHLWKNQAGWIKQLWPCVSKENWLTWDRAGMGALDAAVGASSPSWMQALSTTEASGRSFTFTTIWIDETAWQRNVAAAYAANMPAVASRGQVILTSSPLAGSFFCNVVDDTMDGVVQTTNDQPTIDA